MAARLGTTFAAFFLIATALAAEGQGGRTLSIDLLAGTLDGSPFATLTIDQLTDLLGRPSAVSPRIEGVRGPEIHYHDAGLSFVVDEPSKGDRLRSVHIYLSTSWDKDSQKHYQQFGGRLTPAVDGNWKGERIMQQLAEYSPEMESGEQRRRQVEAVARQFRLPLTRLPAGDFRDWSRYDDAEQEDPGARHGPRFQCGRSVHRSFVERVAHGCRRWYCARRRSGHFRRYGLDAHASRVTVMKPDGSAPPHVLPIIRREPLHFVVRKL